MASVKNKRELKKIAQEWCKSILHANDLTSFDDRLTIDEQCYILKQSRAIADRITKEPISADLNHIIDKYFNFE